MNEFCKSVVPIMESLYEEFSATEKIIADFFIKNRKKLNFSSKNISKTLFVTESALTRFAKKCGFSGYREFVFAYENSLMQPHEQVTTLTQKVFSTYQELLNKSYSIIHDDQVQRVVQMMIDAKKVFVYGIGSSGVCARDFKIRFMRLGLHVESVTDEHIMKMNTVLLDEDCLLICMSISGKNLIEYLKEAKKKNAKTIFITSNYRHRMKDYCDEILKVAVTKNLDVGDVISPQFVILVMIDVLYTHFLNSDYINKYAVLRKTLKYVHKEEIDE